MRLKGTWGLLILLVLSLGCTQSAVEKGSMEKQTSEATQEHFPDEPINVETVLDTAPPVTEPETVVATSKPVQTTSAPKETPMPLEGLDRFSVREKIQLTHDSYPPTMNVKPQISPDGKRIMYISADSVAVSINLYSMDLDGSNKKLLTDQPLGICLAWSPDGSKILYTTRPEKGKSSTEVWIMDLNGGNKKKLMSGNVSDGCPTWSPDGSRIAASLGRSGRIDIWVINIDGSNLIGLDVADAEMDSTPLWSPDGKKIAYSYLHRSATGQDVATDIISVEDKKLIDTFVGSAVFFSPDSKKIAMLSQDTVGPESNLYVADVSGENKKLVSQGGRHTSFSWSSDGEYLFVLLIDEDASLRWEDKEDWTKSTLKIIDAETFEQKELVSGVYWPSKAYSIDPDMTNIVYTGTGFNLWLAKIR